MPLPSLPFAKIKKPAKKELSPEEKIFREGVTTIKDLIAPAAFKISPNFLQLGDMYVASFFVLTYPRYLVTNWLSPIINLDTVMDIAMFLYPQESGVVLKNLQKAAARIQASITMAEEKGMVRDPVLEIALNDVENLRDKLQAGTERLYRFGLYFTIYGESVEDLSKIRSQFEAILESRLVYAKPAIFQMEQAFTSCLPLGHDEIMITNNLNTAPLSTTFPFVSADLTSNDGVLFGINRHNNSLIIFDRFSMENANMVIFAKSGAGKSYTVKLEILRSLMFGTDVIVIDPENEYQYLANTVGGSFLKISLASDHRINPFDLPKPRKDEDPEDVLRECVINLSGLIDLMAGGLTPEESSIVDQALIETYAVKDITPETYATWDKTQVPTLEDFVEILGNMKGGAGVALRLKKYTEGTFAGIFNRPTNISMDNQLVVFNIRDMEDQLRPLAMFVILNFIWTTVRSELKRRLLAIDEAWWMMQHEDSARFLFGLVKRARKYYLGVTTITQDITDFLTSVYGKPIVTNSSIQILLKQSPAAIDLIVETFNLTEGEKYLLLESDVGEGIFFAGLKHVAIKVVASYAEDQIITSDPRQILEIEKAKKELMEEK